MYGEESSNQDQHRSRGRGNPRGRGRATSLKSSISRGARNVNRLATDIVTNHTQRKKNNKVNLDILAPFLPSTHEEDVPDFYENVSPDDPKHGIYAGVNVHNVDITSGEDSSQDRNIVQSGSFNHHNIISPVRIDSTASSSSAPLRYVLLLSITILIPETALVGGHAHVHTPASVASCAVLYCSALELS